MRRSRRLPAIVVMAIVAALAIVAAATARNNGMPTTIGKGEGALNVIEWAAYTDPSFAKPFEQQTGCKIHRKDAGSSNEMVSLMRAGGGGGGGQWDLVSASGDASLRLIYGGDVQPVNVGLIPSWKQFLPNFKSPAHNTVKGVHYGAVHLLPEGVAYRLGDFGGLKRRIALCVNHLVQHLFHRRLNGDVFGDLLGYLVRGNVERCRNMVGFEDRLG